MVISNIEIVLIYRFGYEVAQSGQWKPDHRVGWAYDLYEYAQKSFLDDLAIYDRLVIRRVARLGSGSESKMRSDHVWEFNPVNKAFMVNVMKTNCIDR